MKWLVILSPIVCSLSIQASVRPITITEKSVTRGDRWIYQKKSLPKHLGGELRQLALLKKEFVEGKHKQCFTRAKKLRQDIPSLSAWISLRAIQCATAAFEIKKISSSLLYQEIKSLQRNKNSLFLGPQKSLLQKALVNAQFSLLSRDIKKDRNRGWVLIDRMMLQEDWLSQSEKANLFRLASELAFIEQKMRAARQFALKSLSFGESLEVRDKLITIEKALSRVAPLEGFAAVPGIKKLGEEISSEEKEMKARVDVDLKRGKLVEAVEEAVRIIRSYPSSQYAHWAQRQILQSYLKAGKLDKKKVFSTQKNILRLMKRVDALRVTRWADILFQRADYKAARELARSALNKLEETNRSRKLLNIIARSSVFLGDLREAEEAFLELVEVSKGTQNSIESVYRLGLLNLRQKQYSKAIANFEKIIFLKQAANYELSVRYWLWRALQAQNSSKAVIQRDELIKRYPLTYYGLTARLEREGNISLPEEEKEKKKRKRLSIKVWMTKKQDQTWRRTQKLMLAGWHEEARIELARLPLPQSNREKKVMSSYWAKLLDYRKVIRISQEIWPFSVRWEDSAYVQSSFPFEFKKEISSSSEKYKLPGSLIQAIIRQESAFYPKAVSSANARGLMQLIPSTAAEMAAKEKRKSFNLGKDLFSPQINIDLGSKYLDSLIQRFEGNYLMGIAAYNAGPTRLARWLRMRQLIGEDVPSAKKNDFSGLWVEELPWSETRHYVKAVMRNYIVYRLIDQKRVEFSKPLWK